MDRRGSSFGVRLGGWVSVHRFDAASCNPSILSSAFLVGVHLDTFCYWPSQLFHIFIFKTEPELSLMRCCSTFKLPGWQLIESRSQNQ